MEGDYDIFLGKKDRHVINQMGHKNEYINDISMHFVSLAEHKAADSFRNRRRAKNNRFSPRYCDHTLTESREKEKEHCATVGCVSSNLNKLLHV